MTLTRMGCSQMHFKSFSYMEGHFEVLIVNESKLLGVSFIVKGLNSVKLSLSSQWIRLISNDLGLNSVHSLHQLTKAQYFSISPLVQLMVSGLLSQLAAARPQSTALC